VTPERRIIPPYVPQENGVSLGGLHVDLRASRRLVTLGSDNLVVVLAQVQAVSSPGVEVSLHVHAATDTLLSADRPGNVSMWSLKLRLSVSCLPVLLKGPCSVNGGLVDTSGDGDVVGTAISAEAALALSSAAGVVGAV